jgi:Peptidase family S41
MSTGDSVADLVGRLTNWLHRLMPAGERVDRLTGDLRDEFGDATDPVTAGTCRAVERCAWRHSRHLELHFDPAGSAAPDDEKHGWPAVDPAAVRARAAGVSAVRRLDDGTCVIAVDSLESLSVAEPYLTGAFALAAHASRVVLDLRANGGGDPATVAYIAGRLLGDDARHLSDVTYHDRIRQWWTADRPPGTALTQPAAVLVAPHTYSSAEALAYHLQARGRVTVVGERTRGAADHVTPIQLTSKVLGFLPEAVVRDAASGGNWEGTGVVPDVVCAPEKALEVATQADSRITSVGS